MSGSWVGKRRGVRFGVVVPPRSRVLYRFLGRIPALGLRLGFPTLPSSVASTPLVGGLAMVEPEGDRRDCSGADEGGASHFRWKCFLRFPW